MSDEIDLFKGLGLSKPRKSPRESWKSDFTDPGNHDPKNFTYLVHGVQTGASRVFQMIHLIEAGHADPILDIDLLSNPAAIADKPVVSASIISHDKYTTFGNIGFILEAPYENVLAMAPEDIGTNFGKPHEVIQSHRGRVQGVFDFNIPKRYPGLGVSKHERTVAEILVGTNESSHNEIVLEGKTKSGPIAIKGVFVKVDEDGLYCDPNAGQIINLARCHNLPVVEIPSKARRKFIDSASIQILEDYSAPNSMPGKCPLDAFAFNLNGLRYILSFSEGFYYFDPKLKKHSLDKADYAAALRFFESKSSTVDAQKYGKELEAAMTLLRNGANA